MQHEAFRSVILKDKMAHHTFESCAACADKMYLGTQEGAIMVYHILPKADGYEAKGIQIERTKKKEAITQMIPIPMLNMLLVLIGGTVVAHNLDDMSEMGMIKGVKEIIAMDAKKDKDRYFVATVIRKKVYVHEWRDMDARRDFYKIREYSLPEGVKTVNWSGKNLLLGFKKEFVMLDASSQDSTPASLYATGKAQTPIATNLVPMKELLVGLDQVGVRTTLEGNPASQSGIQWPSLPSCLTYHHPYVLSIHDQNSVEVRNPWETEGQLCQFITIKYVNKLSIAGQLTDYDIPNPTKSKGGKGGDGGGSLRRDMIVATTSVNSVYLLELVPIHEQVATLTVNKQFEKALAMCKMCPDEVTSKNINNVHIYFGLDHFAKRNFSEAMSHFAGRVCPRFAISLYSKFLPPYIEERFKPEAKTKGIIDAKVLSENLEPALAALIDFLRPIRPGVYDKLKELEKQAEELGGRLATEEDGSALQEYSDIVVAIDTALLRAYVMLNDENRALGFLRSEHRCDPASTYAFLMNKREWVLIAMLQHSLGKSKECLEMLRTLAGYGKPETGLSEEDMVHKSLVNTPAAHTIKVMVEKDLIQKSVMTQPAIEAGVEKCATKEGGTDITSLKYQCVGIITAVSIMRMLDCTDATGTAKTLVHEHSAWLLLAIEPIYGLRIFTDGTKQMAPDEVVPHLDNIESRSEGKTALVATYLEIVLGESCNGIDDPSLHNKRVSALIRLIQRERAPGEDKVTIPQKQLEKFLNLSQYYDPSIVIQWLAKGEYARSFYRERAIVYRKMKNHAAAIDMYLNEVNKMQEAQKYATEVSREDGDAFKLLLQYILKADSEGNIKRLDEAIHVINTCEGVDASSALPMLPGNTKLSSISEFLKVSLRNTQAKRNNRELSRNVMANLRHQTELAARHAKSRRCVIEPDTVCKVCDKKIRDTHFARYPNGYIVHQACLNEEHICPITGRDYRVSNIDTIFYN